MLSHTCAGVSHITRQHAAAVLGAEAIALAAATVTPLTPAGKYTRPDTTASTERQCSLPAYSAAPTARAGPKGDERGVFTPHTACTAAG